MSDGMYFIYPSENGLHKPQYKIWIRKYTGTERTYNARGGDLGSIQSMRWKAQRKGGKLRVKIFHK